MGGGFSDWRESFSQDISYLARPRFPAFPGLPLLRGGGERRGGHVHPRGGRDCGVGGLGPVTGRRRLGLLGLGGDDGGDYGGGVGPLVLLGPLVLRRRSLWRLGRAGGGLRSRPLFLLFLHHDYTSLKVGSILQQRV